MTKKMRQETKDILASVTKTPTIDNGLSDAEKIDRIEKSMREVLQTLGLDLSNDSLRESPRRIAKMYVTELFKGLSVDNFPKITTIENDMNYDQMIVIRDVNVLSTCEHHFVTIHGSATIAYIPAQKVIGLSKINRIADYFSRRPQVQERLTKQIADCLQMVLGTENVAVHINAKHYCVISRGVQDSHSTTVTIDLRGDFKRLPETRLEFLKHCTTKGLSLEM
jgi:GTP cyclohydrolase I